MTDPRARSPLTAGVTTLGPRGRITLIIGCMFSGKTTELLRRVRMLGPSEVLVFKHRIDSRCPPGTIVSHARASFPAFSIVDPWEMLEAGCAGKRLIAVDEAHFFGVDLADAAKRIRDAGTDVLLAALDLDSWGRPFSVVERLRAVANSVLERTALCGQCGAIADHTQRLTRIVDRSMVGGPESYEARCRVCWRPPPELPIC